MSYADEIFINNAKNLLSNGFSSKGQVVRPKWSDGTPAHTIKIANVVNRYDLSKEFPILTLRPTNFKASVDEILWIYSKQSTNVKDLNSHIWDEWASENGNIGRTYAYQLETRPQREFIKVPNKNNILPDDVIDASTINIDKSNHGQFYKLWSKMIEEAKCRNIYISKEWSSFESFEKDIYYIPQFFLAKNDNFSNWVISNRYYNAKYYSLDTAVFLPYNEHLIYEPSTLKYGEYLPRYRLSKNQLNNALYNLKQNPYSRRILINLWNLADEDFANLMPCAYSITFNVTGNKLNMLLNQRSGDFLTANNWNVTQYAVLQHMIAAVSGLELGELTHVIADLHIYDRHIPLVEELISRKSFDAPTFEINKNINNFYDFKQSDFNLKGYEHGKQIPIPVAI